MAYSVPMAYGKGVFMRSALAVLLLVTAAPAAAQREDQMEAYEAARSGRIRSLGDILSRLRPEQRRDFIGSEFRDGNYRLKFMERGEVRARDVDARTGEFRDVERDRYDDRREYMERRMREYDDYRPDRRRDDGEFRRGRGRRGDARSDR